MQQEFGAYFPIELPRKSELFTNDETLQVAGYDCGRNAIAVVALSIHASKIYVPYYNCDTVTETLARHNIRYEYYLLDEDLNPTVGELKPDEWILWVNYLGNCSAQRYHQLEKKYKRIIFDNTQALFSKPVIGEQCFNIYSPRKFVGVSDGAYVVWGNEYQMRTDFPQDVSWERALFMLKAIETGTNAAYQDNLKSMEHMGLEIRRMSVLTQRILASIDYEAVRQVRNRNIAALHEGLKGINKFPYEIHEDLMVYPLYVEIDSLRRKLVEKKIYVSQWWKYLLEIVPEDSVENRFTKWLLPIPIDQRYSEEDMKQLTQLIIDCYEAAKEGD